MGTVMSERRENPKGRPSPEQHTHPEKTLCPDPQSIPELRRVVSVLAHRYGAERVYLFGSCARGEARRDSDIDLRIDKGQIRGLQFAGLWCDLEDALGRRVDLISTAGMDAEFRRRIASEEVLLYERE